ncbi:hypothetical protein DER46DRAFT_580133 [Fusarium sp. MPI-SDFR-AT-0072]|nr:hypothetical protein DER46DRAFT_580133 [Fusarium sp. MPI-SDFR-AT-0072]
MATLQPLLETEATSSASSHLVPAEKSDTTSRYDRQCSYDRPINSLGWCLVEWGSWWSWSRPLSRSQQYDYELHRLPPLKRRSRGHGYESRHVEWIISLHGGTKPEASTRLCNWELYLGQFHLNCCVLKVSRYIEICHRIIWTGEAPKDIQSKGPADQSWMLGPGDGPPDVSNPGPYFDWNNGKNFTFLKHKIPDIWLQMRLGFKIEPPGKTPTLCMWEMQKLKLPALKDSILATLACAPDDDVRLRLKQAVVNDKLQEVGRKLEVRWEEDDEFGQLKERKDDQPSV